MGRWVLMVAALTGGAMILMWLGELLTESGLGNGISLLITVGVVSSLPGIAGTLVSTTVKEGSKFEIFGRTLPIDGRGLSVSLTILALTLLLILIVVCLNEAQRRISISYAKRVQGNRNYGGVSSVLPIKMILAGVIPIIFALAFLSIPSFIGGLIQNSANPTWANLGQNLTSLFQQPQAQTYLSDGWQPYLYPVAYFVLVFTFTFFYTNITFNAKDIAENLQKQGGFVADKRPGGETEKYLSKVVNSLTLYGALALSFLAVMPYVLLILAVKLPNLPLPTNQIQIGGTSMLILVSVALETLRQVESKALMLTYDDYSISTEVKNANSRKSKNFLKKVFTRGR
jgi:preprotein translocase subunit SecY